MTSVLLIVTDFIGRHLAHWPWTSQHRSFFPFGVRRCELLTFRRGRWLIQYVQIMLVMNSNIYPTSLDHENTVCKQVALPFKGLKSGRFWFQLVPGSSIPKMFNAIPPTCISVGGVPRRYVLMSHDRKNVQIQLNRQSNRVCCHVGTCLCSEGTSKEA